MVLSIGSYFGFRPKPDAEWQRIINKLWNDFGIRSSGSKSLDKQKLHELELRQAEQESEVKNKFLTVSKSEQEKIQANKKSEKAEFEQQKPEVNDGAKVLGEQIFIAIQMKQERDEINNKRKRNNKYQS